MHVLREWLSGLLPEWLVQYLPVSVEHPERFPLLVLAVLVVSAMLFALRRLVARRDAIRIASVKQLAEVAPKVPPLKRWLIWGYTVTAVTLLVLPFVVRPIRVVAQPFEQATVVGANDTSDSMLAEDVDPNRAVAAERAFRAFALDAPEQVQIGWVTFGDAASLQVPPTTDRVFLNQVIDEIELGQKTALLDGVDLALDVCERVPLSDNGVRPCRIAVLSDGAETVVTDLTEREEQVGTLIRRASQLGIQVDTIGFGTDQPTLYKGEQVILAPDKEFLRRISAGTGGQFYEAANASELSSAYEQIGSSFGVKYVGQVAWEFFTALAALSGLLATVAHLVFYNQISHTRRTAVDAGQPNLRTVA